MLVKNLICIFIEGVVQPLLFQNGKHLSQIGQDFFQAALFWRVAGAFSHQTQRSPTVLMTTAGFFRRFFGRQVVCA